MPGPMGFGRRRAILPDKSEKVRRLDLERGAGTGSLHSDRVLYAIAAGCAYAGYGLALDLTGR